MKPCNCEVEISTNNFTHYKKIILDPTRHLHALILAICNSNVLREKMLVSQAQSVG